MSYQALSKPIAFGILCFAFACGVQYKKSQKDELSYMNGISSYASAILLDERVARLHNVKTFEYEHQELTAFERYERYCAKRLLLEALQEALPFFGISPDQDVVLDNKFAMDLESGEWDHRFKPKLLENLRHYTKSKQYAHDVAKQQSLEAWHVDDFEKGKYHTQPQPPSPKPPTTPDGSV